MNLQSLDRAEPFTTKDGSTIRELHHTAAQSLAEAALEPGQATERHYHGRTEEIYLVIPRRSSVLRTPLEFRILARIANEMSSETVLVTDDPSRRRLANQEGFRTRRGLRTLSVRS